MFPNSSIGFSQWPVVFFLDAVVISEGAFVLKIPYDMHKLFSLPPYLFLPLKNIFNMKSINCRCI